MKNDKPLISVVMATYNNEGFLSQAIESILTQTYENFEFIIINDGSYDNSLVIIQEYMKKDNRIVLISRENKGLPYSLNEGISKAKGKYIARMDSDDISLPRRLEEQVDFMEKNHIDICGTFVDVLFNHKKSTIWKYPLQDKEIKFFLIFKSPFAHPSVMMKRNIFTSSSYDTSLLRGQDYKLWIDIALKNNKMANVDKVLLVYRFHQEQASKKHLENQSNNAVEASSYYVQKSTQYKKYSKVLSDIRTINSTKPLRKLYQMIEDENKNMKINDSTLLSIYRKILRMYPHTGINSYIIYLKYTKNLKKDFNGEAYLLFRSMLHMNRKSKIYQFLKKIILK